METPPPPPPPRPALDPRHRCVPEDLAVSGLAIDRWADAFAAGRRDMALERGRYALEAAIAGGAGYAEPSPGQRLFDFAELEDILDWLAETGRDTLWQERAPISRQALIAATPAGHRPDPGAASPWAPPARFRVTFERKFNLERSRPGSTARLRLPAPLPSAYHEDISVTPQVAPELGAKVCVSDGRVDFHMVTPAQPMVTVGAAFDFIARPPTPQVDAATLTGRDLEVHLRGAEGMIQVTPRVRDLAERLAGQSPPLAAVGAFLAYLITNFQFRTLRYDELAGQPPCDWALDQGGYDCQLCSALLAALCRAKGIPARIVTGHYLCGLAPARHGWAEIWIDGMGWLPVDILNQERGGSLWRDDRQWWDHFARRWDYRLAFERLPLAFTGRTGARFPPAWQMMQTPPASGAGLDLTFIDIADGSLIQRDRITVDWLR